MLNTLNQNPSENRCDIPVPELQSKTTFYMSRFLFMHLRHPLLLSVCHVPWLLRLDVVHDLRSVEDCVP